MIEFLFDMLKDAIYGGIAGLLVGLVPFFTAKGKNRIKMATNSLVTCGVCGVILGLILALPVSIIYTIYICIKSKNEKLCPYCKEAILKEATICRYCKQEIIEYTE